jgi:hypothetical protein
MSVSSRPRRETGGGGGRPPQAFLGRILAAGGGGGGGASAGFWGDLGAASLAHLSFCVSTTES